MNYNYNYNHSNYSNHSMPPKKDDNGWLIGVVSAIAVLSVVLVMAAGWFGVRVVRKSIEKGKTVSHVSEGDGGDFDFDFGYHYRYPENGYEDDYYGDYGYGGYDRDYYGGYGDYDDFYGDFDDFYGDFDDFYGDYDNGYGDSYWDGHHDGSYGYHNDSYGTDPYADTDKEYYEGPRDAVREDLNYSVSWQSYQYDTDYKNVDIHASYPEIKGENIPNLGYINDYIFDEVQFWVESFEDYTSDGYFGKEDMFSLEAFAYVTYMDEDKMSIVYSEYGAMDDDSAAYLYSINVDIKNGVILDNSSIINMDDAFAVEFRKRNQEQNNAGGYVDMLSDQEVVEYLNSSTAGVVFYTPLGLEVGINVDGGWYTVTYKDYEKYLKKL